MLDFHIFSKSSETSTILFLQVIVKIWDPKQERVVNIPDENEVCFPSIRLFSNMMAVREMSKVQVLLIMNPKS